MNDIQIANARQIIAREHLNDCFKNIMLQAHIHNVELARALKLPYKIVKEADEPLNKWYPGTEAPKDMIPWFVEAFPGIEWDKNNYYKDYVPLLADKIGQSFYDDNGTKVFTFDLKAEYQQMQDEYEKKYTTLKDSNRWYYLAHFLQGYDLASFTMFDIFGDTTHTPKEASDFIQELIKIQSDFEKHPNKYYK